MNHGESAGADRSRLDRDLQLLDDMFRSAGSVIPPWLRDEGPLLARSASFKEVTSVFWRCPGPRVIGAAALIPIAIRAWLGAVTTFDVAVVFVVALFWLGFEWSTHRFSLHMKPFTLGRIRIDSPFAQRHRLHHLYPWQLEEILLPLWVVLPAIPITAFLWWLVMPDLASSLTAIATFNAMALVEEWTHYLIHTPHQPRSAFYRAIFRAHRLHHFKSDAYWFCTTFPWVDRLLGTVPARSTE